jgi:hypothetical protein
VETILKIKMVAIIGFFLIGTQSHIEYYIPESSKRKPRGQLSKGKLKVGAGSSLECDFNPVYQSENTPKVLGGL